MDNSKRLWIGIGAAIAGAGLLLLVPTTRTVESSWTSEGLIGSDSFTFAVVIDADEGLIESDLAGSTATYGDIAGRPFIVWGASGPGRVRIEARDPSGVVLIDELVGPDQGFRYPPEEGVPEWAVVTIDHPGQIPEPGGEVIFVLTATLPPENLDSVTITAIGVEPYAMDDISRLDSGRPDSCAELVFPFELLRDGVMRCTYSVAITGSVGEVSESLAFVETVDGSWDSQQPTFVEIVPADEPWPDPPPLVSSTAGHAAAPSLVKGAIVTDEPGRYQIVVTAPEGSTGFVMRLATSRTIHQVLFGQISPSRELGLGFVVAALLAFGWSIIKLPAWRRLAGLPLLAAALGVC